MGFSLQSWNRLLAVDFGSSTLRIWSSDDPDNLVSQPSCIAVDSRTSKVLAIGDEARAMEGRVSSHIVVVYPIQNGVVYDAEAAEALLKALIRQSFPQKFSLAPPSALAVVPAKATEVERNMMVQVVESVGVKEVLTIAQPLAASIGVGVPIADSSGSFIMQMGAGIVETAVISLGSIVQFQSDNFAGQQLISEIQRHTKEKASLEISKETAETVLTQAVSLSKNYSKKQLIAGQYLQSGSPTELEIESSFFKSIIQPAAAGYQALIQKLLSTLPPELTVDSIDKGLLLSGGLANIHGLDDYLVSQLGVPVSIVDQPEKTAILGARTALQHLDLFKESLGYLD